MTNDEFYSTFQDALMQLVKCSAELDLRKPQKTNNVPAWSVKADGIWYDANGNILPFEQNIACVHSQLNNAKNLDKVGNKEGENMPNLLLKHGEGTIVKRTRKTADGKIKTWYQGSYYDDTGTRNYKTSNSKYKVYDFLKERSKKHPKKKESTTLTLGGWMSNWYGKYRATKNRESTNKQNRRYINQVSDKLKKTPLTKLDAEELQDYFNSISALNTRKKIYDQINASLKKALALGKIKLNPLEDVEIPGVKSERRRAFTWTEQTAVLRKLPQPYHDQLIFLFCTGLRIGELQALTKDAFDFENNYFYVYKQIPANGTEEDKTKTESSERIVDFSPSLLKIVNLDEVLKANYTSFKKNLNKVLKELKIIDLSTHCTRHTFSSSAYKAGISSKQIQAWLGHKTLAMTTDTYTHLMGNGTSFLRDYMAELKEFMNKK